MIDLSSYLNDTEHQLWVDSCTAHAGTTALEILLNKQGKKVELDRVFLFQEISKYPGQLTAHIAPILKDIGCPETGWWDDIYYFLASVFKWKAKAFSKKHKISDYLEGCDIKEALDEGFPVIVGLQLREAFKECDWNDYANSPKTFKHAMVVIGYRDNEYLIVNSWGKSWGDDGLCWMPADLFEADCYYKASVEL